MNSNQNTETHSDVERSLRVHLVKIRSERGLTQSDLAKATGFSKGYISKIESGHIVPPIASLIKIADALRVEVADFLKPADDPIDDVVCVVRADERQPAVRGGSAFGYDYTALAHKKRFKHMEPFIFSFPSDVMKEMSFEHEGEEFIFILSGRVEWEMIIDGQIKKWVLGVGDSIYFESHIQHWGRALGDEAKALIIIYTPTRSGPK